MNRSRLNPGKKCPTCRGKHADCATCSGRGWIMPAPKQRTRVNAVSTKRKAENADYTIARREYLAEHPRCECRDRGCTKPATEIHHRKGRVGKLLTDKRYFMAACRPCHDHIELNRAWAKEHGYLINRASRTA